MKKVNNTSQNPRFDWLFGGNPGAIEAQEAQGQKEFVESLQLPKKTNYPHGLNTTEQYHKMGIKVLVPTKKDDMFLGVQLPTGWKKQSTDHSMWNNLVDDKGRIRASIFYKAAFYDRETFINFNHRYISTSEYVESAKLPEGRFTPKFYCVKDTTTNEILFQTEITHEYDNKDFQDQCKDFLERNYPNYKDINAYWE